MVGEEALGAFISALNRAQIPYHVGGSFASSAWGEARVTHDFDIAVRMTARDIQPLADALGSDFIVSQQELHEAVESADAYRMAQVLHIDSVQKFDLFLVREGEYTDSAFKRTRSIETPVGTIRIAAPETIILEKLRWYELGNRSSDRQWNDVVQVLEVQEGHLDLEYLRRWAKHFEVDGLLEEALRQTL